MGASNWAVCPCCLKKAREDEKTAVAEYIARFVSVEEAMSDLREFDAKRLDIRNQVGIGADEGYTRLRTFREDYEIYGASTGIVTVSYKGNCGKCGLSLSFTDERKLL